jgi:hypothetical protein
LHRLFSADTRLFGLGRWFLCFRHN